MICRSHLIGSGSALIALIGAVLFLVSCAELKRPEPNPYLAETQPPRQQEFRWSNGRAPKSVDPARASSAPETDVVRAVYEGLTEVDPATLDAIPGVAEKWSSSDDKKTWTFELRKDAKWSNGKQLTAADFVRSWQRLLDLGEKTAHRNLLDNIARVSIAEETKEQAEPEDFEAVPDVVTSENDSAADVEIPESVEQTPEQPAETPTESNAKLDVVAQDNHMLIIKLHQPDSDLPKLVSHPIFRPVFGSRTTTVDPKLDPKLISNGAFKIHKFDGSSLELERSKTYWNSETISSTVSFLFRLLRPTMRLRHIGMEKSMP
jgi:ABC-type oligopeptide transport system substrate-binding subunit